MKIKLKIPFVFILLLALPLVSSALEKPLEEVMDLGLNVMVIETENGEWPACEYVNAPAGCMGKGIANATKVPGALTIYSPSGEIMYESGEYEKGEGGMTVKIRGNTSAYAYKKPYKIKLQKKADLLLRGDKKYNDKNWVLLNDNQLKLYFGFEVSRLLEEEWTPSGMYVNLILNGEYLGLYYLVESIDQNEKCRMNVSDDGFIVEHDAYWWNEDGQFIKSEYDPLLNYTFKYPDYEDLSPESLSYITRILEDYEHSIKDGSYTDMIDIESFAKWLLGHDILGTSDGGGANFYLSKYDDTSATKIKAGPLWDFDTIELSDETWSQVHTAFSRFDSFFADEATPFMQIYTEIWKTRGKDIYEGLLSFIEDLRDKEKWEPYYLSSLATSEWWGAPTDPRDAADRDAAWINARFSWLKANLGEWKEEEGDAGSLQISDSETGNRAIYDLQGRKISDEASPATMKQLEKGLYIIGGRKVIIK